jgi:hypothetical protein
VLFDLAECLGKTVREIEDTMPASELSEWIARIPKNPWGKHRTESLHLQLMAQLVLAHNHSSPADLLRETRLPWVKKPEQKMSREQLKAFLISIGGKPHGR